MNSLSWLISLSLIVNIALVAMIFRPHARPPTVGLDNVALQPTVEEPDPILVPMASAIDELDASNASPQVSVTSWADLETDDLKELITRLRAVGCPEQTIQDIIIAEVNRRYGPREQDLLAGLVGREYWQAQPRGKEAEASQRKVWKEREALMKEKSDLLVELFGVDPEKQRQREEGLPDYRDFARGNIGFLPEAKQESVKQYLDEFQEKMQDFYSRVSGAWDADARAEQKKLEAEKLEGLAQFLTPQELREFELRNSQMASQVASEINGVTLTRAQYEALYDIRKKYGDSIFNWGDANNDAAARKQIEQNQRDLNAEIAAALGEDKGRELERAKDYSYQQLSSLARRAKLPADTAAQVYDYKQAAEDAAQLLRSNDEMLPEDRQAALQQIRVETETAVKNALGDKTYKRYLNQGGWWLNNIAPTSPR
jgi:hypothetical protein